MQRAAHEHEGAREAELHLLAAGAAAEQAGQPERAAESYLEAASEHGSRSALWALYRLAQRRGDVDLERKAREEMAARERADGRLGVDTVLLAEHYDLVDHDPSRAAALLRAALDDADVGHHAAIGIVISRSVPSARGARAGAARTRAPTRSGRLSCASSAASWWRRAAAALHALDLAERAGGAARHRWGRVHRAPTPGSRHGRTATRLRSRRWPSLPPTRHRRLARAEALWTRQLESPERALEEALHEVAPLVGGLGMEVADAILQLASPAHDGAIRVAALDVLVRGADPRDRARLLLKQARARFAENDAAGALTCLEELLARHPERLDAWELAHAAARMVNHAKVRADAAEKLGEHLSGEQALALFEESAAVRMDELDDAPGAARLLGASRRGASAQVAYARLHELRARQKDLPA